MFFRERDGEDERQSAPEVALLGAEVHDRFVARFDHDIAGTQRASVSATEHAMRPGRDGQAYAGRGATDHAVDHEGAAQAANR